MIGGRTLPPTVSGIYLNFDNHFPGEQQNMR